VHDELQRHNRRATILLLVAGFLLLFLVAAAVQVLLFGVVGDAGTLAASAVPVLVIAGVIAGVGSVTAWWTSDRVAIAASRARPADPAQFPDLHRLVEGLTIAAGLPKPALYVIDDPAPNAFATGRSPQKAAVAVTRGLLETMDRRELEAVLAHELGHVRNNDLLTATVAVTLAGATLLLADIARRTLFWGGGGRRRSNRDGGGGPLAVILLIGSLLVIVLAPIAAQLLRFAVSRQREYLADATAVEFTRDPSAMISALRRLQADTTVVSASRATAHLWIEEPLDLHQKMNRAVATHPPLEDRIARLAGLFPGADPGPPPPNG
jgi:heat shock protein HtpX